MIRSLLAAQLITFAVFGMASMWAFDLALESRLRDERSYTRAAVYLSLPPAALTEVKI